MIDFTQELEKFERKQKETAHLFPYEMQTKSDVVPGVDLDIYRHPSEPDEIYLSASGLSTFLGFSRTWLTRALARPKLVAKLKAKGLSGNHKRVLVAIGNGAEKECMAIPREDVGVIVEYAASLDKVEAKALNNTFFGMGLLSAAGLDDDDYATQFKNVYGQCRKELGLDVPE